MESRRYVLNERRRHLRVEDLPMSISVDGETYDSVNWSLGGFMVEEYDGNLTPGALLSVQGMGQAGGALEQVEVLARVAWSDASQKQLAVNFLDLDERAFEAFQVMMDCWVDRLSKDIVASHC
ncbi:MAG: PilZ domain-containing protein [Rhodospirillales bacterium]|nr:PilZ domain-containing protein [Rhodospirillales bacterium]